MCRRQQDVHRNLDLIGGNCSPSVMCEKVKVKRWKWKRWKWKSWKWKSENKVLKKKTGCPQEFGFNWRKCKFCSPSVTWESCAFQILNSWILCLRRIYWNIYFQLISNLSTFRMWLKLPRCKSCCLPQGGGCNSYNLLFPPSLSSSLPPPFSSFSSLLLFLSSYSPARLSSSGRELWIFRRSSCKCFTMSGDGWWCAPNFFHQERCFFSSQKLSPRKVWCGQFHLHFCKDWLSPCDWWLPGFYLFTRPCHWLCDQMLAFDLQNMYMYTMVKAITLHWWTNTTWKHLG